MPLRALLIPFVLSTALHGALILSVGAPPGSPSREPRPAQADWVKIDYVRVEAPRQAPERPAPVRRAAAEPASPPASVPAGVVDARTLLRDARKARQFLDYFERIKERVQRTLRGDPEYRKARGGEVALYFILDEKGQLDSVSAVPVDNATQTASRDLAVKALRSSVPFDPIPSQLGARRILFRLSVVFGER